MIARVTAASPIPTQLVPRMIGGDQGASGFHGNVGRDHKEGSPDQPLSSLFGPL